MVACLEQLATAIWAWSRAHPEATLAEQEEALLGMVRQALPELLRAVLYACTSALTTPAAGSRQPCPGCGKSYRPHQRDHPRTVLTACGAVTFARSYYYCRRCQAGWAPADAALGLSPFQRLSERVRGWLVGQAAKSTFREAARDLADLAGVALSAETVRTTSEAVGAGWVAAEDAAAETVQRTREAAETVDPAPGKLVVETDGVMVRFLGGWHEVKLGVVGGYLDGRLRARSYVGRRASAEAFGPLLSAEAARRGALAVVGRKGEVTRRGLYVLREVVVLGDGAVWIWKLAEEQFGERVEIVDFYHASEHLWGLANKLHGLGSLAAERWADLQVKALHDQGPAPVLEALAAAAKADGLSPEQAEAIRKERGYFRNNAHRMDYPRFRALGLPIGSGAVEGAANHYVGLRLKHPGSRWSTPGGDSILALRARSLSDRPLLPKPTKRAA
jgi:hypothetical protein